MTGVGSYSGRGAARAEDAQGTPTQSHVSPSILVYEEMTGVGGLMAEVNVLMFGEGVVGVMTCGHPPSCCGVKRLHSIWGG